MILRLTVLLMIALLAISLNHYVFGAKMSDALGEANKELEGLLNSTSITTNNTSNQTTGPSTIDNDSAAAGSNQTTGPSTIDNDSAAAGSK
jgi:hypothetical protein